MMNLQEFMDDSFTKIYEEGKSGIDRYELYKKEIKNTEPTVELYEILNNPLNEETIYLDYSTLNNTIFFSQIYYDDDGGDIIINYIQPIFDNANKFFLWNGVEQEYYTSREDMFQEGWPSKYILFDEKVFNKFMNPHENPEFLNWKSSPWGVKQ